MEKVNWKIVNVILIVIVVLIGVTYGISANNQEKEYRNLAEAQMQKIETQYDNMWKVIQQKAQVTDQYKESFKEIFVGIIDGRYNKDNNVVMKWIQESNPNFDVSMYKDLMATIDIKRTEFMNVQNRMIDIVREHKNLCMKAPKSWFISNTTPIEFEPISSTQSKQVMSTKVDDNIDIFKK